MRKAGLEPARPKEQRILSPMCLPFHHFRAEGIIPHCTQSRNRKMREWHGGENFYQSQILFAELRNDADNDVR